jgi:hypothetical protein
MPFDYSKEKELILFSDESETKGKFYSNFYGGVLVPGSQYLRIKQKLDKAKEEANISSEVKWTKVSPMFLDGYKKIMDAFFDEILAGNLKVRIMFRQNAHQAQNLTDEHKKNQYFILYYQFIKNAFGLDRIKSKTPINLRLYFDQFPDNKEKVIRFKTHILELQNRFRSQSPLVISEENITEIDSDHHLIIQCLDVVLGSMAFRLNDKHKEKPEGQRARPKRTVAKETLYKYIRSYIVKIKPSFNAGVSTGPTEKYPARHRLPYAHWSFKPNESLYRPEATKRNYKKRTPSEPT